MTFKQKHQQIEQILVEYKDAPKQGTDAWLKQRTGIGGSEMAIITGDSTFSNIKDLIRNHVGLSAFKGNRYTRWGCLFEEQIRLIVEIIMECTIYEIGSVEGCIPYHRYSPDGLATMKLLMGTDWKYKSHTDMYKILTENPNSKCVALLYDYVNVLLEFKCPSGRIPTGKIPKEYLPQVKSGLCDLLFCDIALFINAAFRKCSYADWKPNNIYDMEYHKSDNTITKAKIVKAEFIKPMAIGGIGLYMPLANTIRNTAIPAMGTSEYDSYCRQQHIWNEIVNCGSYGNEMLLDFGKCPTYLFNGLLELYSSGEISAYYFKSKIYDSEFTRVSFLKSQKKHIQNNSVFVRKKTIDNFRRWCYKQKYKPLGYLPWKLFKCDFIVQPREADFLKSCENKINEVMKHIHMIQQIDDMDERLRILDQLTIASIKEETKKPRAKRKTPLKKKFRLPNKVIDNILEDLDLIY